MSLTRRFLNLAKANLNALLDHVAETDATEPTLDRMTDEELEAELMRRKARREREEEMRRAREEAERAARARQASQPAGSAGSSGASGQARTSTGGAARPRAGTDPRRLAQLYAQLEVPVGSDLTEVKASYRRLMRKYHPDNYGTDPKKAALATELTQKLSQAYRELEGILRGTAARKRM